MTGSAAGTRDKLLEGARDIASLIAHKGSLDEEHVIESFQRDIKGLASRTGQMYATASDEVFEALQSYMDEAVTPELLAQYTRRFPVPSAGK